MPSRQKIAVEAPAPGFELKDQDTKTHRLGGSNASAWSPWTAAFVQRLRETR
jgi:hypothetical protein